MTTTKRIYLSSRTGRVMEHQGYATRYYWSPDMITFLRKHYPTTTNQELTGIFGFSDATIRRKARQLGISKDPEWCRAFSIERCRLARVAAARKGYPGAFRKGQHPSPATEFKKGRTIPQETMDKIIAARKAYNRTHPDELRQRGLKAAETRRKRLLSQSS